MLVVASILLVVRLGVPPAGFERWQVEPYVGDEAVYAFTAHRLSENDPRVFDVWTRHPLLTPDAGVNSDYARVHPPFAMVVMSAFIRVFGFHPFAFRFGSVICGVIALLSTWFVARRLGGPRAGPRVATVALVLLATDGMFFVSARIATLDVYVTAATMVATAALVHALESPARIRRWVGLAIALGVGASCKWSIVPIAVAYVLIAFVVVLRRARPAFVRVLAVLTMLPLATYVASYGSFLMREDATLPKLAQMQVEMLRANIWGRTRISIKLPPIVASMTTLSSADLAPSPSPEVSTSGAKPVEDPSTVGAKPVEDPSNVGAKPVDNGARPLVQQQTPPHEMTTSPWYAWPFNLRPMYWFSAAGRKGGVVSVRAAIVLIASPFVGFAMLPAIVIVVRSAIQKRNWKWLLGPLGIALAWLPWSLASSQIFAYYFGLAVPFAAIVVALALEQLAERFKKPNAICVGYMVLAALSFAWFYPVATAMPLSPRAFEARTPFTSWSPPQVDGE